MDEQKTPKEQYEEKRRAKQEKRAAQRSAHRKPVQAQKAVKWLAWIVVLGLVVGGIVLWAVSQGPEGEDLSVAYEIQGREHIEAGTLHDRYNSNPPSSGPHWPQPARTGVYDEPVPDEQAVHNLEHGDIWIAYHPRIGEAKEELRRFDRVGNIITPREENDADIAVVAWGRVDAFDIEGENIPVQRIEDFITRYKHKGPEQVPSVGHR